MKHLGLTSSASTAFKSPLTEIFFVHFPSDIAAARREEVTEHLSTTLRAMSSACSAIRAVSWGWGVETDFPSLGQENHAGSVFAAAVGWQGLVEQEMFACGAVYRSSEAAMRSIAGVVSVSKVRVSLRGSERKME